jgi:cation diffusion facilitator CzcD-associated flavoprotein CzcO
VASETDIVIVGAGPYGLSIAAFLRAQGTEHRIFGPAMALWRAMPKGMFLKSLDFATNVYAPRRGFTLVEYCRERGISSAEPFSMGLFADYGEWAQQQLVPHLEKTPVQKVSHRNGAFEVRLEDGTEVKARRVVMATGLTFFEVMPGPLKGLPRELVSHTADNPDFEQFRGKDVAVLGAGQSALQAAVLIHESGGRPQLISRCGGAAFADPPIHPRPLRHRILHPMSVLGASRTGFALQHIPFGFHYLPEARRLHLSKTLYGPWGAWWLAPRYHGNVPGIPFTNVVHAAPRDGRLALRLRNVQTHQERELIVDHLTSGTGYEPDVDAIPLLDRDLASRIARVDKSPRLSIDFESSVPGLHFVGASAAHSFGPMFRFVSGAGIAAPALAKHFGRSRKRSAGVRP